MAEEEHTFSGMTAEQRFHMDVYGYLVVPSLLSKAQVQAMLTIFEIMAPPKVGNTKNLLVCAFSEQLLSD